MGSIAAALVFVALGGVGNQERQLVGNGRVITEERPVVGSFDTVAIGFQVECELAEGAQVKASLEGDENILRAIRLVVRDGKLMTVSDHRGGFRTENPIRLRITAPNVSRLEASGAASIRIGEMEADKIVLAASGAALLEIERVNAARVEVSLSGAATARLAGTTRELDAELSGAARLHAIDLDAEHVNTAASGGANAKVAAATEIKAAVSGGSALKIRGSPRRRDVVSSGGAKVHYEQSL